MVSIEQKNGMSEYLVQSLEVASTSVRPQRYEFKGQGKVNCVYVGDDSVLFLVDRVFGDEAFNRAMDFFKSNKRNVVPVFYKDGETYFRSAARDKSFKQGLGLSLSKYSSSQVQRMILLRPEEIDVVKSNSGHILYYQPKSTNLEEAVVSLEFKPVRYNYEHIVGQMEKPQVGEPVRPRYVPDNANSKKIFIWDNREDMTGDLALSGNSLRQIQ